MRRILLSICLLLTAQALPAFAAADANKTSAPPITIGISLGLTGRYTEESQTKKLAFELWAKQVNQRGGLLGRPVQLIIRDDLSDPDTAAKIYKQFTEEEKVDHIFAPYSSQITAAVAPVTERNKYPMLAHGAIDDTLWSNGYKYLFGVPSPATRYVLGFFALLSDAGVKRISVVGVDKNQSSIAMSSGAKRWASEYGLEIVHFVLLPPKNPDLEAAAKAARSAGAEAMVVTGHYEEAVNMRRVLKRIGWTPTAYYATNGPLLQKFYDVLGPDVHGTFATSYWEANEKLRLPGSFEFFRDFRASFNLTPSHHSASAYAAGQILEQAILKAGTIDRAVVRDTLSSMETDKTVLGRYAVDSSGLPFKRLPMIVQWQGAKREIVWPQELRTALPILNNK